MRLLSVLKLFTAKAEIKLTRHLRSEVVLDLVKDDKDHRTLNKVFFLIVK